MGPMRLDPTYLLLRHLELGVMSQEGDDAVQHSLGLLQHLHGSRRERGEMCARTQENGVHGWKAVRTYTPSSSAIITGY